MSTFSGVVGSTMKNQRRLHSSHCTHKPSVMSLPCTVYYKLVHLQEDFFRCGRVYYEKSAFDCHHPNVHSNLQSAGWALRMHYVTFQIALHGFIPLYRSHRILKLEQFIYQWVLFGVSELGLKYNSCRKFTGLFSSSGHAQ
jgi:hypothetical protein